MDTTNCDTARPSTWHALANLRPGVTAVVKAVDVSQEDAARLKSLGICDGRCVELLQQGDPLIVRVLASRVGLSSRLAEQVHVEPKGLS